MAKWADYGIHAVRYDEDEEHIEKVKVKEDLGETFGPSMTLTREKVVSEIEGGKSLVTIFKTDEGKWRKGEDVHIVKVGEKKYIRTDKNATPLDNLENLPEF